ncbi:MAG: hypothetical protein OXU20_23400 [Myxococcales bacterium]|nr:hypothetical protein [Myxococcales bacterium]MDD9966710.1 hypothetical protein [Myxococcales bacterium]
MRIQPRTAVRVGAAFAVLLACTASSPVRADRYGFEAAVRMGYGIPFGDISRDTGELSRRVSGQFPLWLDLGYRAGPYVFAGLYGQYGFGSVANDEALDYCSAGNNPDGAECAVRVLRAGAQVHLHVLPYRSLDPWFGVGIGYEHFASRKGGLVTTMAGFEAVNLQFGLDLKSAGNWFLGPWVAIALGRFTSGTRAGSQLCGEDVCTDSVPDGPIRDALAHQWLMFGVRIAFQP